MNCSRHSILRVAMLTLALLGPVVSAADPRPALRKAIADVEFQRRFDDWKQLGDDASRARRGGEILQQCTVSSAQVKRLAQGIADEDARAEFVFLAFPKTVDQENFYDVYDTFQSFSKVFRLHDRLEVYRGPHGRGGPRGPVVSTEPPTLDETEFANVLATIRAESFDNTRLTVARVAGSGLRHRISAAQVTEVLGLFSFDNHRLDCAKLAVDWVRDPENLYLLYPSFTFENHKRELTRAIEARVRK